MENIYRCHLENGCHLSHFQISQDIERSKLKYILIYIFFTRLWISLVFIINIYSFIHNHVCIFICVSILIYHTISFSLFLNPIPWGPSWTFKYFLHCLLVSYIFSMNISQWQIIILIIMKFNFFLLFMLLFIFIYFFL